MDQQKNLKQIPKVANRRKNKLFLTKKKKENQWYGNCTVVGTNIE